MRATSFRVEMTLPIYLCILLQTYGPYRKGNRITQEHKNG